MPAEAAYTVGDVIMTRKPHACGGSEWLIMRTGADYKIKCLTCGRTLMLSYEDFVKKVKKIVRRADIEKQQTQQKPE